MISVSSILKNCYLYDFDEFIEILRDYHKKNLINWSFFFQICWLLNESNEQFGSSLFIKQVVTGDWKEVKQMMGNEWNPSLNPL